MDTVNEGFILKTKFKEAPQIQYFNALLFSLGAGDGPLSHILSPTIFINSKEKISKMLKILSKDYSVVAA